MGRRAIEVLMQLIEAQRRGEAYAGPSDIVLPVEIVRRRTLPGPRSTPLIVP
jgi:LacI family transcriptional regulator